VGIVKYKKVVGYTVLEGVEKGQESMCAENVLLVDKRLWTQQKK
jgi:hypothetical protein